LKKKSKDDLKLARHLIVTPIRRLRLQSRDIFGTTRRNEVRPKSTFKPGDVGFEKKKPCETANITLKRTQRGGSKEMNKVSQGRPKGEARKGKGRVVVRAKEGRARGGKSRVDPLPIQL